MIDPSMQSPFSPSSPSQRRYTGTVKSMNTANGFGFIACPETHARYQRDVFLHHKQAAQAGGRCVPGTRVEFSIQEKQGQPQARDVTVVQEDRQLKVSNAGRDGGGGGRGGRDPVGLEMDETVIGPLAHFSQPRHQSKQKRFRGTVKSMNLAKGFGFISCRETERIYGSGDVFLHKNQVRQADTHTRHCVPGQPVHFNVDVVNGQPQARDVRFGLDEEGDDEGDEETVLENEGESSSDLLPRPSSYYACHTGTIKSLNSVEGFGFISCAETERLYNRDVFLHRNQAGEFLPGQRVFFFVEEIKGQPQARHVRLVEENPNANHDPLRDLVADPSSARGLRILSLGSGDASLSCALVQATQGQGHQLVTTFYDTKAMVLTKYRQGRHNLEFLARHSQLLRYRVDATVLPPDLAPDGGTFDLVLFFFPHTGVPNTDEVESILSNQALISGFLASVAKLLSPTSYAQLVVGSGHPYDKWDVRSLVKSSPLQLHALTRLDKTLYPGYVHKPTLGAGAGDIVEVADRDPLVYTLKLRI